MANAKLSSRDSLYWMIFVVFAIATTYVMTTLIRAGAREDTAFSQESAYKLKRQARFATVETSMGTIEIVLARNEAPNAVANFAQFAEEGYYDGTKFHRAVKGLLVQGGDPLSRESNRELYGTGGPGYVFEDEITERPLARGDVAFANRGKPDTNGSQFFILVSESAPSMDGKYTVVGRVARGMEVVDQIANASVDVNEIPITPIVLRGIIVE